MTLSISDLCRASLLHLQKITSVLSQPGHIGGVVKYDEVNEELERFSLFIGNIGAIHESQSPMSVESRLHEAKDVLTHISNLLEDLGEVLVELLDIVSGNREGMVAVSDHEQDNGDEITEENELLGEISETITRLFRISILIRRAAPTDLFAKALSRNRYRFNDQFDIGHVGEKYPKLATSNNSWLRERLGRAITQRRHYLSYVQDHRDKLGGMASHNEREGHATAAPPDFLAIQSQTFNPINDSASRPSFFTKATSIIPEQVTSRSLVADELESEDEARSFTTITQSVAEEIGSSIMTRIPKLNHLRIGHTKEIECPFCFRIKRFKNERTWRKHAFSDLRPYVCTFQDCNAPYFGDINKWFEHEMTIHRVVYKCFLCPNEIFYQESRYLSHLKRAHEHLLDDEEQAAKELSRMPLTQIAAEDCPCCSDWPDRLAERNPGMTEFAPGNILSVAPAIFKRHLAGHLEQLALFAVPIVTAQEDENLNERSDAAIEDQNSERADASNHPFVTFTSSPSKSTYNALPDNASSTSNLESYQNSNHSNEISPAKSPPHSDTDWRRPETLKEQIVPAHVDQLEVHSSATLDELANRALACKHDGRWAAAANLYARAVELSMIELGQENHQTLRYMNHLAAAWRTQSMWSEAEAIELQLVEICKKTLGVDHPGTLSSMTNLGSNYWNQGRIKDAEEVLTKVVEVSKKTPGIDHPDTLKAIHYLLMTYTYQGRHKEAEGMQLDVLDKLRNSLGSKHLDTLTAMSDLAAVYREQKRYSEAEELLVEVEDGLKKTIGEERQETLKSMTDLAFMIAAQGRYEESHKLLMQALEIHKKVLGRDHPRTLRVKENLASVLVAQENYEEAHDLLLESLESQKTMLGEEHPETLSSMESLARLLRKQKKYMDARTLAKQLVVLNKKVFGEKTPQTVNSLRNLASDHMHLKELEDSIDNNSEALDLATELLGKDHPDALRDMEEHAKLLKYIGRIMEAINLLETCLEGRKRVFGDDHELTKSSISRLDEWRREVKRKSMYNWFDEVNTEFGKE